MTFQQINLHAYMHAWYRLHRVICYCLRLAAYLNYCFGLSWGNSCCFLFKISNAQEISKHKDKVSWLQRLEFDWTDMMPDTGWHGACGMCFWVFLQQTQNDPRPLAHVCTLCMHGQYGTEALKSLEDAQGYRLNPMVTVCSGSGARCSLSSLK